MRRYTTILIFLVCLAFLPAASATAFLFDDTLVSIDGDSFTVDDFKHWWKFWKEEDTPLPITPDPYIDFLLLSREAESMGLASAPGFKRATRIFLQSRGLLKLKYEAVDSRIKITDSDIKNRYNERYQPRWVVQRLHFKDEAAANAAWQELSEGTLTVDDLVERDPEQGGPESTSEGWIRPGGMDPGWAAIFHKTAVGEVVDPSEHNKGLTLYHLKEQVEDDAEDFAKLREDIEKELWKEREDELTLALINELRAKYEVEVNEERLAALDINGADDTFTDAAVITSNRQNVSEKEFIAVFRKLTSSRPTFAFAATDEEKVGELKSETAYNIISQSVTNWESLDRHYEEKEPFKWAYEFNYNYRLYQELDRHLFLPEAKVTDEEIKQTYEENIARYSKPTVVKLYIIDETEGPIDQIWADIAVGKDLGEVLKQQFDRTVNPKDVPANHLDPEVKAVVDNLVDGETSQIFSAQGIRVMVHLVKRTPGAPLPLQGALKESIRSSLLKEKVNQLRSNLVEQLRSRSDINVRMRQWKAIQKELGGA